ncbi:MAG: DNA polymerase III subunit beta [Patescibacteria group bacterium]
MNFKIKTQNLIKALQRAEKTVGKNFNLPILSNVFIKTLKDKIEIRSTNLEIGLSELIKAEIKEEGEITIKPGIILSVLNQLKNSSDLELFLKDNNLQINGDFGKTKIKTESTEDFPQLPKINSDKIIKINFNDWFQGIRSVVFSAATSDIKPEISSVYIYSDNNKLFFVSTDSLRLAEKNINFKKEDEIPGIIIPYKNALEINRIFEGSEEISFKNDGDKLEIKNNFITLISRTIEGVYPDYRQIIPKSFKTEIYVDKTEFLDKLKIAGVFADKLNHIKLNIKPKDKSLIIESENQEVGESHLEIKSEIIGEELEVSYNYRYINEVFQSIFSDKIFLGFNDKNKPLLISGANDPSFIYLVMPINK